MQALPAEPEPEVETVIRIHQSEPLTSGKKFEAHVHLYALFVSRCHSEPVLPVSPMDVHGKFYHYRRWGLEMLQLLKQLRLTETATPCRKLAGDVLDSVLFPMLMGRNGMLFLRWGAILLQPRDELAYQTTYSWSFRYELVAANHHRKKIQRFCGPLCTAGCGYVASQSIDSKRTRKRGMVGSCQACWRKENRNTRIAVCVRCSLRASPTQLALCRRHQLEADRGALPTG